MSKILGYIGLGIAVVLVNAFFPVPKDWTDKFIVGGVAGAVGYGIRSWLGSVLDKK